MVKVENYRKAKAFKRSNYLDSLHNHKTFSKRIYFDLQNEIF